MNIGDCGGEDILGRCKRENLWICWEFEAWFLGHSEYVGNQEGCEYCCCYAVKKGVNNVYQSINYSLYNILTLKMFFFSYAGFGFCKKLYGVCLKLNVN